MMALTYAQFVERGCLCGTDRPADCPLHDAHDLRGLAAFFKAGMPNAFPAKATCGLCKSEGLLYPNVDIDDPKGNGRYKPTLVCPKCSHPANERILRAEAESFGYELNGKRVFWQHD